MIKKLASVGGRAFQLVFRAIKIVRPQRPIHADGVALVGTLERFSGAASGISWIDTAGTDDVVARFSRSIGLPGGLPDILGLAIRVPGEHPGDLLVASTGRMAPARFLLWPRRDAGRAFYSSLMPYHGSNGPVLMAAVPESDDGQRTVSFSARLDDFRGRVAAKGWTLGLFHATPAGSWIRFGTLRLTVDPEQKATALRFDPVLNPLPGAGIYTWVRRLREPSYALARS